MRVLENTDNFGRINVFGFVQGYAEMFRAVVKILQPVHVVGNGNGVALLGVLVDVVIPGGPGGFALRQNGFIGVQHHFIHLIRDRTQHLFFIMGGITEHLQRLIAVTGKDHLIKVVLAFFPQVVVGQLDAMVEALNRLNRGVEKHLIFRQPFGDGFNV